MSGHFVRALLVMLCATVGASPAYPATLADVVASDGSSVQLDQVLITSTVDIISTSTFSSFTVKDDTRAAYVFGYQDEIASILGSHQVGDVISLTVAGGNFAGAFQLHVHSPPYPAPTVTNPSIDTSLDWTPVAPADLADYSSVAESLESQLVTVQNVRITSYSIYPDTERHAITPGLHFSVSGSYYAEDALGHEFTLWVRSPELADLLNNTMPEIPVNWGNFQGILYQCDFGDDPSPVNVAGVGYGVYPLAFSIPEPSSLILLGLAAATVLRRRRLS
jgi:hypothetical protein